MVLTCRHCSRANPADAFYCHHDGAILEALGGDRRPLGVGMRPFLTPFVFPSGRACQNFDQLGLACQGEWPEAVRLLRQGILASFFGSLGRADLAGVARAAADFPDPDRGLDQLLGSLPTQALTTPRLHVTPDGINLGRMRVGQDHRTELHISNRGGRLLHGSVSCDQGIWLSLEPGRAHQSKLFQTRDDLAVPLYVRGTELRAAMKSCEARVVVESNGGSVTIPVAVEVPVTPFPDGVLAGALTPRQVAEKAKKAPRAAAPLFESGAVAAWYRRNGWAYPVAGPAPQGLASVQQFFEALGLTRPPVVSVGETTVYLAGVVGERLSHALKVKTEENRPVYATAVSDQWWLQTGKPVLRGSKASIPLEVPFVPHRPNEVLKAVVTVTANGNQRSLVTVLLAVGHAAEVMPTVLEADDEVFDALDVVGDDTFGPLGGSG